MKGKQQAGFTLIELMIALVLTGLVMMLLFSGLRVGSRSWDAADKRQQQISGQYQLQQLLRRLISQAKSERVRDINGKIQVAFRGEPEELIFVATAPNNDSKEALHWYRLHLVAATDEEPEALVLESRPFNNRSMVDWPLLFDTSTSVDEEGNEVPPPKSFRLQTTYQADLKFSFSYFEPGVLDRIESHWEEELRLPMLVDMVLEENGFEASGSAAEEELVSPWSEISIALQEYSYGLRYE